MLVLTATIDGDKIILQGLANIAHEMPAAIGRGLNRIGPGIYAEAFKILNGPSRAQLRVKGKRAWRATGWTHENPSRPRGQSDLLGARPGSYPVPKITGNLLKLLGWVGPGESKSSGDLTFTAGALELVLFDSAAYATSVFLGKDSSAAYGERDAIRDGMDNYDKFSSGGHTKMADVLNEEIQKEIDKNQGGSS
jgi:hypothetical protein